MTLYENGTPAHELMMPEIQEPIPAPVKVLPTIKPIMDEGLKEFGIVPPVTDEDTRQVFYDKIVAPATGDLDEVTTEKVVEFIGKVQEEKNAGTELPSVLQKIADKAETTDKSLEVQETVTNKLATVDSFLDAKTIIILVASAILFYLMLRKSA